MSWIMHNVDTLYNLAWRGKALTYLIAKMKPLLGGRAVRVKQHRHICCELIEMNRILIFFVAKIMSLRFVLLPKTFIFAWLSSNRDVAVGGYMNVLVAVRVLHDWQVAYDEQWVDMGRSPSLIYSYERRTVHKKQR